MTRLFFFAIAAVCGVFSASANGQGNVYFPAGTPPEVPAWSQPYPGLGNALPGVTTAPPPAATLFADPAETSTGAEITPTTQSSGLYLFQIPNNKRTGMFQKGSVNWLWIPDSGGANGLGMTELDLSVVLALPMPTAESPLLITPEFKSTFFDTKNAGKIADKTFYTTGVDLRWIRPLVKDKLTADLGFGVFYSGDFHAEAGDAVRFPAHVAGIWNFNPRTKIVFGVLYLDRHGDYNWCPMAGAVWTPTEDIRAELVFPRIRYAQRLRWFYSSAGEEQQDWLYTAFEFGSGSWGIEGGGVLNYRDYRLLLGYERRTRCGVTLGIEVGYAVDRTIEHSRVQPADSVFLRLRTAF
ncbi:MAG: hypothetical protein LBH00_04360 [Planctomycetaceae bacterium]|nr:hypothetical protein [Planctomycetaceae bacterium]